MESRVVVGAAVVRGGRLLAARRTRPPAAAGRWELPGGKVEPGETPEAALVRELHEELGLTARVRSWLDGEAAVRPGLVLRVAVVDAAGEPTPTEHDAVRWLSARELDDVDWLEPDRPFLPPLRALLAEPARGIFFDEDDARAAVAVLRRDGYEAHVERERLAGEDDDEDHPWAVLSDAPVVVLELLVEQHDGWLDQPEQAQPAAPPPELPTGPRRLKRPPTLEP